jgi:hypothetical protein
MVVRCTGAYLNPKAMLVSSHLELVDHHTPLDLLDVNFRFWLCRVYRICKKMVTIKKCNA